MKKIKKIYILSLLLILFNYQKALAAQNTTVVSFKISNPLSGKIGSVSQLLSTFVDWIINLGTVAVVLFFIYVGFQFVAARGNPDAITKARSAFLWTVVGTLVLIGAKVLTEVIKNTLTNGGIITT